MGPSGVILFFLIFCAFMYLIYKLLEKVINYDKNKEKNKDDEDIF